MLSRDSTRTKYTLQLRNVEPKDSHDKSKSNGWEEVEVLGGFVECGWVLEDGESASTETH
jgi:hypothetical protein